MRYIAITVHSLKILRLCLIASMYHREAGGQQHDVGGRAAASVAPDTAMPQSAFFNAGAVVDAVAVIPTMCRASAVRR